MQPQLAERSLGSLELPKVRRFTRDDAEQLATFAKQNVVAEDRILEALSSLAGLSSAVHGLGEADREISRRLILIESKLDRMDVQVLRVEVEALKKRQDSLRMEFNTFCSEVRAQREKSKEIWAEFQTRWKLLLWVTGGVAAGTISLVVKWVASSLAL